ncbi:hypothetical protein [Spirochaeta dissipatitropha]
MRTTIRMNEVVLRKAKKKALEEHMSLTSFIEKAVLAQLKSETESLQKDFELITFGGSGVQKNIDLSSNSHVRDRMDL